MPDEQKKMKYPKRLLEHKPTLMVKEDFYAWNIYKKEKSVFYVLILASLIVCLILYPMWPYPLKLGVFYVSFALLIAIVIINIVRYILYFTLFVFGLNVWIFP